MKPGDRFIYRNPAGSGPSALGWHDEICCVVDTTDFPRLVGVDFDNPNITSGLASPDRLYPLIDWSRPIELDDGTPLILTPPYPGSDDDHVVEIRRVQPGPHPAFPGLKINGGSARRSNGLVISNHGYHVRNRKIMSKALDPTQPLWAADGRAFSYNVDGYGITVEKHGPAHRQGQVMFYGWLDGQKPALGGWWYDDGTPARSGTPPVNLTDKDPNMPVIDTSKPLRLADPEDNRKVTFITETSDGHILVSVAESFASWIIFTKAGAFVRSSDNSGSGLKIKNKPERRITYHAIVGNSVVIGSYRSLPMLWAATPAALFALKVVTEGEVTVAAATIAR